MTLVLENVSKLYGDTVALDRTSFTLNCGIYGMLGPNGAGKTTLLRDLARLSSSVNFGNGWAICPRILEYTPILPQNSFCCISGGSKAYQNLRQNGRRMNCFT